MADFIGLLQLMTCGILIVHDGQRPGSTALAKSLTHAIGTLTKNVAPRLNATTGTHDPRASAAALTLLMTSGNNASRSRPTSMSIDISGKLIGQAGRLHDQLSLDDIALPDHLEGVRIERDGQLNREFRKEVLLGVAANQDPINQAFKDLPDFIGPSSSQRPANSLHFKPEQLLTKVFHEADVDKDGALTVSELSSWIAAKVNEHLDKAIKSNIYIFMTIDKDHNGLVTWDEYHRRYLLDRGYDAKYVAGHSEKHKDMSRQMREEILLDEAGFAEAARTNDDGLNIDEFLSFRHPEHSHATLLNMANDIFDKLDENGDDLLSAAEFVSLNQNDDVNRRSPRMSHEMWMTEREREFVEVIDANKDGKVTRQELVMYSDPKNPSHALMEAKSLVDAADANRDDKLSLAEVIANKDLFLGSKMVDISKKIHDEF